MDNFSFISHFYFLCFSDSLYIWIFLLMNYVNSLYRDTMFHWHLDMNFSNFHISDIGIHLTINCIFIIGSIFFFLFGTKYNRAFNNPWHLSKWNMILTLYQSFSFQIVFPVIIQLPFLFSSICVLYSVFLIPGPFPIFNYPPGRIHSLLYFPFFPDIITKPTFFGSTWPFTL